MNKLNERTLFGKTAVNVDDTKKESSFSFRKGVTERLSSPFGGKKVPDRVPGHDMLTFE